MKNGSKRTISRIVAFIMLVTCMLSNIITTSAKIDETTSDVVVSGSAVDTQYKWSADDLTLESPLAANPTLDGEIFTYNIVSGKSKVSENKKTFADGSSFAQRLQMGGSGSLSTNAGVFDIAAPSAGKLYVYAVTGSNGEGRPVELYGSDETIIDSDISGPITDTTTYTYPVFVYDIAAAGTYKVTSVSKGVNFYGMAFVAEGGETPTEATTAADTTTEATTVADTTTEATTVADEFATPVAGKVYSADFTALAGDGYVVNDKLNGKFVAGNTAKLVSANDTIYYHDAAHGLALANGDQIQVQVAGKATITLNTCQYGKGEYVVTDAAGNTVGTVAGMGATDGEALQVEYDGEATMLTITLTADGETYLHGLTVSNAAAPIGVAENFSFWLDDIATDGVDSTGAATKVVEPGEYKFADSTLTLIGNGETKYTPEILNAQNIVRNGRVCNAYKAGSRHKTANDIPTIPTAGEGTCIVFTPAETGTFVTYFYSTSFLRVWDFSNDGTRNGYVDSSVAPESYAFKAEAGHTYVLSTTGKTNNMAYAGFEYIKDEPVTVSVSLNPRGTGDYSSTEIYLTDADLGTVQATVLADTTSVDLAKGHTYVLSTNDGGVKATVAESDRFKASDEPVVIDLDDIPDETLTGTITGTPSGTVSAITFTNMVNGAAVDAVITGDTYTAVMKPGEYNTSVVTNNGGVTYDRVSVQQGAENVNEVYVEVPEAGNGVKYDLPTEVANAETKLTLNGITANNETSVKAVAGSSIIVPVTGTQKVTVAGWYAGTWDINGQNSVTADSSSSATSPVTNSYITDGTETSVTVNVTGEGSNYLYWIMVEDMVAFKSEISVPGDYDTLNDAVTAIRTMVGRPEGEEGRVTINLTADIQEQVVIDTPYVMIKGNGHTISWYYGVGTFYYSIDGNTGLYSERLFRDKYSSNEGNGSLWGGTVIVRADYFKAEDTTFKNTYNYEVTDKEILDFAKTATSAFPQRTSKDVDVQSYAAKERSNALYVDGNFLECKNCNIMSSQDTLGANKDTDYYAYFNNCVIGGNTDFICGAGNMVFDNCELQWKSTTQDANGNNVKLIGPTPREGQYVFRNCDWTVDTTENGTVLGKFGRTWQQNSKSVFINTETNGLIDPVGWGEMSAGQFATSEFIEYNNYVKGIPMDVTTMGNIKDKTTNEKYTDEEIKAMVDNFMDKTYTVNTVLGGWEPTYYGMEDNVFTTEATTEATTFAPVEDNGYEYVADPNKEIVYAGDRMYEDNRVRVEAAQNLSFKVEEAPVMVEGREYINNVTSNGVNTTLKVDGAEAPSTYRIHTTITAKEDIKIVIDTKVGAGKTNTVLKDVVITGKDANGYDTGTATTIVDYANAGGTNALTTLVFELKAGETAYFAGKGTNPPIYGIDIIGGTVLTPKKVWGDVDSDDAVTVIDANMTLQYTLHPEIVEGFDATVADVSDNGVIDSEDVALILQKVQDSTFVLPVVANGKVPPEKDTLTDTKVFVVGDSTGCHYAETADATYYYKRVGFGDKLGDYLNEKAEVVNLALSGRSSKSFTTEPEYQTLLADMKAGDYLIIAFGHNDEKYGEEARYTAPSTAEAPTTKDTEGSFKNSLYVNYIQKAIEVGATPILCTPTVRRTASGTWSDSQLHKANGGDYSQDVRDLAAELNITCVDNTALTQGLYDELTPSGSVNLHAWTNEKEDSVDNTHLNNFGAKYVAYLMATAIGSSSSALAPYVKDGIVAPTKSDLIVNPDYVPGPTEDLTGDDLISKIWKTSSPWYATAFGDIGGLAKLFVCDPTTGEPTEPLTLMSNEENGKTNFAIDETANGVNLRVGHPELTSNNVFGKISSSSDGIEMYYQPVDAAQNFQIKGTVKVNSYQTNNQVAFGAIVTDTVQVDKYEGGAIENYVAASPLKIADIGKEKTDSTTGETYIGTAWAGYARIAGVLTKGTGEIATTIEPGSTVDVSITKVGDKYTVNYGGQISEFTVPMTGTVYAGFYAARCADVEVTNIVFNNEVTE